MSGTSHRPLSRSRLAQAIHDGRIVRAIDRDLGEIAQELQSAERRVQRYGIRRVMRPNRLLNRSPLLRFALLPSRSTNVGASARFCARNAFLSATFPLAAALRSTNSRGVTPRFVGFSTTMPASDFSMATAAACGLPSRGCSSGSPARAPSRSPVRKTCVNVPRYRTRGKRTTQTHVLRIVLHGLPPEPTASASPEIDRFEALSPGPLTRPPTLHPVGRPTTCKD